MQLARPGRSAVFRKTKKTVTCVPYNNSFKLTEARLVRDAEMSINKQVKI